MKKEFYNIKYGKCNLLDKENNLYLLYTEKCDNWFTMFKQSCLSNKQRLVSIPIFVCLKRVNSLC
ncbi:MAG: hypothetical protein PUB18_05370 [bacterium]|nr:hypothetical protein [bacterium]